MLEQIELLLGLLTFSASSYLGLGVYRNNRSSWTNRLFLILTLCINVYIVVNYLSLHPPQGTPENQLFWIRQVMFICSFIGPVLLLLVHTFPGPDITLRKRYLFPMLALMATSAVFSLLPLVFSGITYPDGKPIPTPGPGIIVFFIDFIGLFLTSFGVLIYKYLKSKGEDRVRLKMLLVGVIISFSIMGLSTVIFVVILKTSAAVFLGPISFVVLAAAMGYAIVKHQLFGMRTLAAQAFTGVISIILFAKIFVSPTTVDRVIDIVIFVSVLVSGVLLTRSVMREVEQREELSRLAKKLSDFISFATHELRGPITAFKGAISMIMEGNFGKVQDKTRVMLNKVYLEADEMGQTVETFLNMNKIEIGKFNLMSEEQDFIEVVESAVEQAKYRAGDKKIDIKFVKPKGSFPAVNYDRFKIKHAIGNLLSNAIKYTEEGGKVRLTLEHDNVFVVLNVTDTGIGIPPDVLPNLFNQYNRGAAEAKRFAEGSGIGLWLTKQIVGLHGGKLSAESKGQGMGSTFVIKLPVNGRKDGKKKS